MRKEVPQVSMFRASGRLFLAASLLAGVAAVALAPARTGGESVSDPHAHFRIPERCPSCHVYAGGAPAPDRFVSDADAFCLGCHQAGALGRTHPGGVRPAEGSRTVRPPEDFPLDEKGGILCLTCHRGHGEFLSAVPAFPGQEAEASGPRRGSGARYRTYYARRSDPVSGFAPLCRACHPML